VRADGYDETFFVRGVVQRIERGAVRKFRTAENHERPQRGLGNRGFAGGIFRHDPTCRVAERGAFVGEIGVVRTRI